MGKLSDEEKMGVKAGMVVAGILSTFALPKRLISAQVCFAAMYLVMLASDDILYWIPGYHSAMLTFVCYLMLPARSPVQKSRRRRDIGSMPRRCSTAPTPSSAASSCPSSV